MGRINVIAFRSTVGEEKTCDSKCFENGRGIVENLH